MTPKEADAVSNSSHDTTADHDHDDSHLFVLPTAAEAGFRLKAWADESSSSDDDSEEDGLCFKIHPLVHRSSDGSIVMPKTADTTDKNKDNKRDTTKDDSTHASSTDDDEESCTTLNDMHEDQDSVVPTPLPSTCTSPERRVRFCQSVRVVQYIKNRPEDASRLYYSCHELQKIIDDHEAERRGGVGLGGMEYLSPF